MRIDIPYSLLVRHGDLAWSTGQCPLDKQGEVVLPGDLPGQVEYVRGIIAETLPQTGLDAVAQLTVYHIDQGPDARAQSEAILRKSFGKTPIVTFVEVPHFYYDGMMVEIDVHAAREPVRSYVRSEGDGRPTLTVVEDEEIAWVQVRLDRSSDLLTQIETARGAMGARGLDPRHTLTDRWIVAKGGAVDGIEHVAAAGLMSDPLAAVACALDDGIVAIGDMVVVKRPDSVGRFSGLVTSEHDGLEFTASRIDDHFAIKARCKGGELGNVGEMRRLMEAVKAWMAREGFEFQDVCKVTTFYVGGSSADELHDNMAVRNACYRKPGPASTGIPVRSFASGSHHVVTSLVGRRAMAIGFDVGQGAADRPMAVA